MTARSIRFLSADDVFKIHRLAMLDQGVEPRLRDAGLLDSALAMPRQQFGGAHLHPDIPSMAAAYAFHIAANHPFEDGNKRAATAAMIQFLSDNGWSFDATADEAEPVVLKLASGQLTKEELTRWVVSMCHEKPSLELRDFFAELSHAALFSTASSMNLSDPAGIRATVLEATQAIPILEVAMEVGRKQQEKGDSEGVARTLAQLQILVALYRIAEDMGYEW